MDCVVTGQMNLKENFCNETFFNLSDPNNLEGDLTKNYFIYSTEKT